MRSDNEKERDLSDFVVAAATLFAVPEKGVRPAGIQWYCATGYHSLHEPGVWNLQ